MKKGPKRSIPRLREITEHELVDAVSDGIIVQDTNYKIIRQNRIQDEVHGDHVGEFCYKAYEKRDTICEWCPVRKTFIDGKVHKTERRIKNGKDTFHYELTSSPLYDSKGKIIAAVKIVRDITKRKEYEEAVRESEQRFRNLIETTSDWVWEVDEKGVYTYASPKVKDILGYSPEEVIGKTPFDFMPPEEAKRTRNIFTHFVKLQKPFYLLENINIHKDGHKVVLETSGAPFFNKKTKFSGYRGIDRDTTQHKHMSDELRKHRARLMELVEERTSKLKKANENLQRESGERKILERLLINIEERERRRIGRDLHDGLGQLLTGLAFKTRGLGRKLEKNNFDEAEDAAELSVLIDEAKEQVSHITKGLHPVDIDSEGLMRALEEMAFYTRKVFGINCSFTCEKPVYLKNKSAATQLYRIAQEAVNNAVKHGAPRNISISLIKKYNKVKMVIRDDGKGIADISWKSGGMGLKIMNYRASLINASLDIRRAGRAGTIIICIFSDMVREKPGTEEGRTQQQPEKL